MKHINKIGMMLVAGSMLAATSCSDFSDYNEVPDMSFGGADKTLWENISSNPNLSDFTNILTSVGYNLKLDSAQTYTVWAPVNGSFDASKYSLKNMPAERIIKEFLNNHIANYAHQETDVNDTVIYMLNKKLVKFSNKNTGEMQFDGKNVISKGAVFNDPCSNGILYSIDGQATYRNNGYEYIMQLDTCAETSVAGKYRRFIERYNNRELDEKNSVKGEIVNGIQKYEYAVYKETNSFISDLRYANNDRIFLNTEDSLATLLVFNDEAWDKTYAKIKSYYNYITPISYQNLSDAKVGNTKGGTTPTTATQKATIMDPTLGKASATIATPPADAEIKETAAYWSDSLATRCMMNNIIYSYGYSWNKKFANNEKFEEKDSIYSTTRNFIGNPTGIDKATVETVTLSNGYARILNDFPFSPKTSYAPTLKTRNPARVVTAAGSGTENWYIEKEKLSPRICQLDEDDDEDALRWVKTPLPSGSAVAPELDFYLNNVLSTEYDCYIVMVPAFCDNAEAERLPYTLRVDINYTDAKNTQIAARFDGNGIVSTVAEMSKVPAFICGAEKVDTVKLGRVKFPICYANTEARPNIKVMSTLSTFNATNRKKYTQELRVANIILRPVLEDEKNEGIKED